MKLNNTISAYRIFTGFFFFSFLASTVWFSVGAHAADDTRNLTEIAGSVASPRAVNGTLLYVNDLRVTESNAYIKDARCPGCGGFGQGIAQVQIVDQNGNPVPNATILGQWDHNLGEIVTLTTNAYGWASTASELVTFSAINDMEFTFCVVSVFKKGWALDPDYNAHSCAASEDVYYQPDTMLMVSDIHVTQYEALYRCPGCGGVAYAEARVRILDEFGMPVPNAAVVGRWNEDPDSVVTIATNGYGLATCTSDPVQFRSGEEVTLTFCVIAVAKRGWEYAPEANTVTCSSSEDAAGGDADGAAALINTIQVNKSVASLKGKRCPDCGTMAYATAAVQIVDTKGNPIPSALIVGEWSGQISSQVWLLTQGDGWGTVRSGLISLKDGEDASFTFCVISVIASGFTYDPDQSMQTCAGSGN